MQKQVSSANGGMNSGMSLPSRSENQCFSFSPNCEQSEGLAFTSLYSSIFPPKTSRSNSVSLTPSACSFDEDSNNATATENRLYLARLTLEYQQMLDRYGLCFTHLQEASKEAEALRRENAKLRIANRDLTKRLSILSQANSLQNRFVSPNLPSLSIINDFSRLCVGDNIRNSLASGDILGKSPTSVIGNNQFERRNNVERISLPKSISIRSSGYLKMNQAGGGTNEESSHSNRLRVSTTPPVIKQQQQQVPVAVGGGKTQEEAMEFEVYNQGMLKTELCNKWQETGTCPYGEQCQFAHGVAELRPIIRHPRYKTELCRMVLAGDPCPYGHRCHFRHALTEQEKLMGPTA